MLMALTLQQKNLTRTFWHYSLPAIAALMVNGLYQIVGGAFLGHVMGAEGLAAVNLAWPFFGVLLAIGMMIGMGSGACCAIAQGEQQYQKARRIVSQAFWLQLGLGILAGQLMVFFADDFMRMQSDNALINQYGQGYLIVLGLSGPVVLASLSMPLLVRNLEAPRLATLAMVAGALTNIILDYWFIVQMNWGLKGMATATVLSESISVIICSLFIFSRHNPLRPCFKELGFHARLSVSSLTTGLSSMLMYLYLSVMTMAHNLLFLKYGGSIQVAAYTIAAYLMAFYYLLSEGVSGGMQPLTSFFYGARQYDKVLKVFRLALLTAVGGGMVFVLVLLIYPKMFAGIFISGDDELMSVTLVGMRLHLCLVFLDGFIVLAATFFQSLGMVRYATLITLTNMLILFPFLALLPPWAGVNGVWLAMPLSNLCLALIVCSMLYRQIKRMRTMAQHIENGCN